MFLLVSRYSHALWVCDRWLASSPGLSGQDRHIYTINFSVETSVPSFDHFRYVIIFFSYVCLRISCVFVQHCSKGGNKTCARLR
jgi:hypothetical protein